MIKKATLDFLAKTKDPGKAIFVNRSHPEFKEIFQWVYRGVSFALVRRVVLYTLFFLFDQNGISGHE